MRTHNVLPIIVVVLWGPIVCALGQEGSSPPASAGEAEELAAAAPVDPGAPAEPPEAEQTEPKKVDYFVRSRGFGARNETEPPGYVKPLSQHKLLHLDGVDWLEFGIEQRTRWEYRDDNYRQPNLTHDDEFLLRTRVYLGIKEILDPFRFVIEFQDSREFGSDFPETNRDADEAGLLQAYGELYFKDALGADRPIRFQAGRMSFDDVDRKLIGRNRWRNTTNNFDGFRLQLGQQSSDWQLDVFALQPVVRQLRQFDHGDEERWFYGVTGAWRRWSKYVTLEPYYLVLDENRKGRTNVDRKIHTIGLHAYGPIGSSRFDFDVDGAYQFGEDGARDHRAFATYAELSYSFKHDWKPRLSISGAYATGDRDPDDNKSERFDRLFGAGHFWSTSDFFTWRNMIMGKICLDVRPTKKLRIEASYGSYWLAGDSDAWPDIGRRDRTGRSGDFVGQEIELRMRYQLTKYAELEIGYSHFFPGAFVENTGPADDGDFFYVQTTVRF